LLTFSDSAGNLPVLFGAICSYRSASSTAQRQPVNWLPSSCSMCCLVKSEGLATA